MRGEGSVGYLTNRYSTLHLQERIEKAPPVKLRPLIAQVMQIGNSERTLLSFSEIVVIRQRLQAAHLYVKIGGMDQACPLVGDGLLVATPVGSSGYNRSQGGPYLPLNSPLLTATGLAVHHTSNWRNAVVADRAPIEIKVQSPAYRPVRLETYVEALSDVVAVSISYSHSPYATLLLEERPWLW
jgi:NAD+ kinase